MPAKLRIALLAVAAGCLVGAPAAEARLSKTTVKSLLTKLINKNDPDRGSISIFNCERSRRDGSEIVRCRIRYERDGDPLCGKGYVREDPDGDRRYRIYGIESCSS
jgi:hypothetical protein